MTQKPKPPYSPSPTNVALSFALFTGIGVFVAWYSGAGSMANIVAALALIFTVSSVASFLIGLGAYNLACHNGLLWPRKSSKKRNERGIK